MDSEISYILKFLVGVLLPFVVVAEFYIRIGKYNVTPFHALSHFMAKAMICAVFVLFLAEWIFLSLGVS